MRRRRAAVCSAVAAAPRAISFLCRNDVGCLWRPILFCLARKEWGKKRRWTRNRAVAPEKLVVLLCVLSLRFRRQNALRAAVGSGFPSARHAVQVVLFAPVEYLTYGSRKAVLFTRAAMHIAHKRTSAQGTSETDAEYFDYNADLSNTHLHRVL